MSVYTGHWPNWIISEIYLNPEWFCLLGWIITATLNSTIACKFLAVSWRLSSLSLGVQDILGWNCAWFPGATFSSGDTSHSQDVACLLRVGGGCELGSYSNHCCLAFPLFLSSIREWECLFSLCWLSQSRHWLWNCVM